MSLGKLLTAGKSLVGGQEATSRYRMHEHLRLPKFISPRNPFATEASAADAARQEAEVESKRPVRVASTPPVPTDAAPGRAVRRESSGDASWRLSQWWGRVNPFSRVTSPARQVEPLNPCFSKGSVQGELHLDQVRVVRNDLSDADLEIVPARKSPAPDKCSPQSGTSAQLATTGGAWRRLSARIFH